MVASNEDILKKESITMVRIYGIPVKVMDPLEKPIAEMSNDEREELLAKYEDNAEPYTLSRFLDYLNADMINTKEYYYLPIDK